MSTSLPFPYILSGDDDWHRVSQEITFLTTVLKSCRPGNIQSAPSNPELQFFQHISTLLTTGRLKNNSNETVLNAVTGRVTTDKIVSVVVTCNAYPKGSGTQAKDGTGAKIVPSVLRGKALLETWKALKTVTSFPEHLQNIVDALGYISSVCDKDRLLRHKMTLFIHRCALPKLSARVQNATGFWGDAPFRLVAHYYRKKAMSIKVTRRSFALNCLEADHVNFQRLGLNRDQTSGMYHVASENIGKWVDLIDATYDEIESILMHGKQPRDDTLSIQEVSTLVKAMKMFSMLLKTKELTRAIIASKELDDLLQSSFRTAAMKKNEAEAAIKLENSLNVSSSLPQNDPEMSPDDGQDTLVEDDALDGRELYDLGGSAHMLRYCRTIAAWYDAASAVVLNARRYPLPFDVYHVDALPTKHKLAEEELFSFRKRCLTYFEERAATDPKYDSALIFLQEKLGDNIQVQAAALNAANAMVHAEATVMGLACISVLGDESFGEVSIEDVRKMFPESGTITIAVSKKCCRGCAMLAEILKDTLGIDFALPGTHATFYPWTPPRGVPVDALKRMRDALRTMFEEMACTYIWIPASTQTSPASSDVVVEPHDDSSFHFEDE